MTCKRTQGFLAKKKATIEVTVDARKQTVKGATALELLGGIEQLYVAKGRGVVHVDLRKERPAEAELLGLLLGPTGNLRAPTVRKGRTLLVGFDEATYAKLVK